MSDTLQNIKDREPNLETIELLEGLLDEARTGEVRSIFFVVGYDDDLTSHGWRHDPRNCPRKLAGESMLLQAEMMTVLQAKDSESALSMAMDGAL